MRKMITRENAKRYYEETLVQDLLELFDANIRYAIENGNPRVVVKIDSLSKDKEYALVEIFRRYGWYGHVTLQPDEENPGKTAVTFEIE